MKQIEITTSKGRFLVVDMDFESVLDKYKGLKFTFMYPLKHISELEASEIVSGLKSASIIYLHSLLESKGIHLFENPYKGYNDILLSDEDNKKLNGFKKGLLEQKTFYNPYIFKIK